MDDSAANSPVSQQSRVRFADFELDFDEHRLKRAGQAVHLQPKSFLLLATLVRSPGHLFAKEALFDLVWSGQVVTDGVLTRSIKEVRKALGDDAQYPRFIETVPRVGYRFIGTVSATAPGVGKKMLGVAALVLTLGLVASLIWIRPIEKPRPAVEQPTQSPERIDITALNADRFEQQGWVSMSLRGEQLEVAQSSFEKALEVDPRHAGAKSGLAITLLLRWPGRRDDPVFRQRVNTLITQAMEIAPDLASAHGARGFQLSLGPSVESQNQAEASLRKALDLDPNSVEAMNWLSTIVLSQGRLSESIELKRRALTMYPSHSTLTGNLAQSLGYAGRLEEARQLIDSHRQISGGAGPMIYPLTILAAISGRLDEVARINAEAILANPRRGFYRKAFAEALLALGRFDQARAWIDRERQGCVPQALLEIASNEVHLQAGEFDKMSQLELAHLDAGQFQSASTERYFRSKAGIAAIVNRNLDAGITQLLQIYPDLEAVRGRGGSLVEPANDLHYLAYAYLQSGQTELAHTYLEKIAREIAFRWKNGYSAYSSLSATEARNLALLGDSDQALAILERAVSEGWRDYNSLLHDPRWDSLREDPRLQRVLQLQAKYRAEMNANLEASGIFTALEQIAFPPKSQCTQDGALALSED